MNPTILRRLKEIQARAKLLNMFGTDAEGRSWNDRVISSIQGTLDATQDEMTEHKKYMADLFRRAHDKVPDAITELRGLVVETTINYLTGTTNFGQFFEVRNLADNQAPAIVNTTRQEIQAAYVGMDGRNEITKLIKPRNEVVVDLHELVSDEVEYRIRDIYTGDISEAARATFDVSFDLKQQLEKRLYNLFVDGSVGVFGAFDTTNANEAARTFKTHSRIAAGVLPTTNDLSIVGVGGSTKFGFSTLDEIIDYHVRFTGTEAEGDARPTGDIIVPAQDIREVLTGITPTNAKQNEVAEELLLQGWMSVTYGGVNWRFIPDNTIPRKICYARSSKPAGILWFKPGMADMEETVDRKKNLASRWEKIVIAIAIPIPWRRYAVRVTYRT